MATKPAPTKKGAPPAPKKNVPAKLAKGGAVTGYDYGAQAGAGAEDVTSEDFLLPFIRIVQTNSPELNKRHEKYVEGAEAGMFLNVSTRALYNGEEGFPAHLCYKTRSYAEFIPRDSGGGFVAQHPVDSELVEALRASQGKFGKLVVAETGNELVETYYAYVVLPGADGDPEGAELGVFPFASTAITPFKQFLMVLNPLLRKGVPIFAPRIRITTRFKKNKEGEFFVPNLAFDGSEPEDYLLTPDDPLIKVCADLRQGVVTGTAKADFAKSQEDAAEAF